MHLPRLAAGSSMFPPKVELSELANLARRISFPAKSKVFAESEPAVYMLALGTPGLNKMAAGGRRQIVGFAVSPETNAVRDHMLLLGCGTAEEKVRGILSSLGAQSWVKQKERQFFGTEVWLASNCSERKSISTCSLLITVNHVTGGTPTFRKLASMVRIGSHCGWIVCFLTGSASVSNSCLKC
jgi:hypothetical protein